MKDVSKKESARILLEGIDGVRADLIAEARIVQNDQTDKEAVKDEKNRKSIYITESLIAMAAVFIMGLLFWNVLRSKNGEAVEKQDTGTYLSMEWPPDVVEPTDVFYKAVFAYVDPENAGIPGFRDDFGGLHYSEYKKPIVSVTSKEAVAGYEKALVNIDDVTIMVCSHSYKELVKVSEEALDLLREHVEVKDSYVDSANNQVRIPVSTKDYKKACEIVKEMPVLIIREEMAIEQATEMETE